ncbi:MAG: hypothetical protein IJ045_06375 [Ruminiclostridium sp.]|nr:hypothetical protein [Ruminiclostridium sp.]
MKERVKRAVCISLMFILFVTSLAACDLPKEVIEKIEGYIVSIIKGEDITSIFIGDSMDKELAFCEKLELSDKVCITDSSGRILPVEALTEGCRVFFVTIDDIVREAFSEAESDFSQYTHLLIVCD